MSAFGNSMLHNLPMVCDIVFSIVIYKAIGVLPLHIIFRFGLNLQVSTIDVNSIPDLKLPGMPA
jgi:hypothetical protein